MEDYSYIQMLQLLCIFETVLWCVCVCARACTGVGVGVGWVGVSVCWWFGPVFWHHPLALWIIDGVLVTDLGAICREPAAAGVHLGVSARVRG